MSNISDRDTAARVGKKINNEMQDNYSNIYKTFKKIVNNIELAYPEEKYILTTNGRILIIILVMFWLISGNIFMYLNMPSHWSIFALFICNGMFILMSIAMFGFLIGFICFILKVIYWAKTGKWIEGGTSLY